MGRRVKKILIRTVSFLLCVLVSAMVLPISAADDVITQAYNDSQYKDTMELNNSISVGFVKNNSDKINGQNPFMKIDGNSFGFEVDYSL
jgi:vancomycin permeability regulator SanA